MHPADVDVYAYHSTKFIATRLLCEICYVMSLCRDESLYFLVCSETYEER